MSLYAALFSGVSGLGAYSSALGIISDNITNVNTTGYKNSTAEFSTLVTESNSSSSFSPGGVKAVPRTLISRQGLLQSTNAATDLGIDGAGFFVVKDQPVTGTAGEVFFTRAGSFRPDADGFLKNAADLYLMGWQLQSNGTFANDGNIDSLVPINTTGLTGTAEATTFVRLRANLQSSQPVSALEATYNASVSANNMASGAVPPDFFRDVRIFDAQGGTHTLTFSFLKSSTPNQWHVEVHADPATDITTTGSFVDGQIATGTIAFNTDGSLDIAGTTPALLAPLSANWVNGSAPGSITLNLGTDGEVDGITQFDSTSTLISSSVDGAVFGNVIGVSIGKDGIVTALFDNGLTRSVYKLPVATFQNPDGLTRVQGNAYGVSDQSGTFSLVEAGTGGGGSISPSSLESSTVDLAAEFTQLITTQRAFSASTRIITTADEMLTELNQIKR
ncbi:MAG: flagellar hook-basal body complex protein [Alphaproteobacteria bacterium]|nr:MAG: flagellar hook-basal body complex protein [Alphaproteobacteria bacterium]